MSFDHLNEPTIESDIASTVIAAAAEPTGFATLSLPPELLRAVLDAGYTEPTDVQLRAIPAALAGSDLLVSSRTGSGKTAAFVLPALKLVLAARNDPSKRRERGQPSGPRVLVLAPTRELAQQVAEACSVYGRHVQGLRVASIVGGVPYGAQLKALRGPLDILIATPGRLLDHLGSGKAMLGQVEMLVLDEADRMLDMGFIDDIHAIANTMSKDRQTVMFSATFAGPVASLAQALTKEPIRIAVNAPAEQHAQIEQRLHWADNRSHRDALLDHLLIDRDIDQCVVFTSTQRDADELADRLQQNGHHAAALHGAMPQGRRNRVLQALRSRQLRILVATDVAARGIDVPTISHVINYGLPMKAEDYVHRIGRTGRAGRNGLAITIAERRDVGMIRRIERFTSHAIPPAIVAGLEPRMPAPEAMRGGPARPAGRGGFRDGGHRPAGGGFRDGGRPQGGGFRDGGHREFGGFREGAPQNGAPAHGAPRDATPRAPFGGFAGNGAPRPARSDSPFGAPAKRGSAFGRGGPRGDRQR
jgi:superfamily II DNA/RNA helicase